MAPLWANETALQELFSDLRTLRDELNCKLGTNLIELSMGMSNDYQIAVKEGATMIRIGRKLFN